jgi:hypothetical protein
MANTKISALTSGNPALGTDIIPIDRSGSNFSITAQSIVNVGVSATAYGFFGSVPGLPPLAIAYGSQSSAGPSTVANQVYAFQVYVPFTITINKMVMDVTSNNATDIWGFGYYDASGNLLGSQTVTPAANTVTSTTWLTPLTLTPGVYYFAQTSSGITSTLVFLATLLNAPKTLTMIDTNRNRSGLAANASAAGVLPATLGAISTGTTRSSMLVYFEN